MKKYFLFFFHEETIPVWHLKSLSDLKIGKLSKAIRWSAWYDPNCVFFTLIRSFNNHQIIKPSPLLFFDFEWFQFTDWILDVLTLLCHSSLHFVLIDCDATHRKQSIYVTFAVALLDFRRLTFLIFFKNTQTRLFYNLSNSLSTLIDSLDHFHRESDIKIFSQQSLVQVLVTFDKSLLPNAKKTRDRNSRFVSDIYFCPNKYLWWLSTNIIVIDVRQV